MLVNVNEFRVNFLDSGSIEFRIQSNERKSTGEDYPTCFYLIKEELPDLLMSMKGESSYCRTFKDISYFGTFSPSGIHMIELRGGHYTESYFNVPLKYMTELHDRIQDHINDPKIWGKFELSPDGIQGLKEQYAPKIEWLYNHDLKWIEGEYKIIRNVKDSLDLNSTYFQDLHNGVESLERIASNYSTFGELITIHISFDSYPDNGRPDSYYFDIRSPENQRIMNGGLICHSNNDGSFSYSMHT